MPPPAPTTVLTPVAKDIIGRWCPTPESAFAMGCVTVALPAATYDDGTSVQLTAQGDTFGDGGFQFIGAGAPFGGYYPAGFGIELPDYYSGADVPDQHRIWNGQTSTLMLRE